MPPAAAPGKLADLGSELRTPSASQDQAPPGSARVRRADRADDVAGRAVDRRDAAGAARDRRRSRRARGERRAARDLGAVPRPRAWRRWSTAPCPTASAASPRSTPASRSSSSAACCRSWRSGLEVMLLGRFLQGIGAAGPRIVTMALVRDQYAGRAMARIMSLAMTVFILVPILAPAIGQAILLVAHWRAIFGMLLAVAAGRAGLVRAAPAGDPAARAPHALLAAPDRCRACARPARNRAALGYTLMAGLIFGALHRLPDLGAADLPGASTASAAASRSISAVLRGVHRRGDAASTRAW